MLGPYYQVAKAFFLSFTDLPIFVGSRVPKLFQCKAAILELFGVYKVNIRAVAGIFEFFGLLFDIIEDMFVEVR